MDKNTHQSLVDLAVVLVIPAIIIGGFYLIRTSEEALLSSGTTAAEEQGKRGEKVKEALAVLEGISLDSEIFTSPAFLSLEEYQSFIPTPPVGRENPFVPSGKAVPASPAAASGRSGVTAPRASGTQSTQDVARTVEEFRKRAQ